MRGGNAPVQRAYETPLINGGSDALAQTQVRRRYYTPVEEFLAIGASEFCYVGVPWP